MHAVVGGTGTWGTIGSAFFGIRGQTVVGEFAVRDEKTAKPLAFGKLASSGATKVWTAPTCV